MTNYEDHDKSNQHLKFEDDHFPAYFRLLKWKFLDVCIESMNKGGFGYFTLFKSCFPKDKLAEVVEKMTEEVPQFTTDPDFRKLRKSNVDEKAMRQGETYLKKRHEHKYKVQKRRYAEYFLKNVLFNEEGLRIADRLMYEKSPQVYGTSHWQDLPKEWVTHETFKEKFYDEAEVKQNRFGMQKLDRVAGSARGMIIMKYFGNNPHCSSEAKVLEQEVNDDENMIHTDLVRQLLDEGPEFQVTKDKNGEEQKTKVVKWNVHQTLILFFTIPGFNMKDRKPDDREEWFYGLLEAMRHDPANRSALHFLNKKYAEELDERDKERDRLRLQVLKGQQVLEEGVGEQIFETIRPQPVDNGYVPTTEAADLVLRTYQEELVQTALEGKNCVIIAPTGSGKTEVAIYAAMKHIVERNAQGKASRVALLVPKIPLVTQQKERFLKYCAGKYIVNGFHGSEKSESGEGRKDDVIASHIVVMTPQILINMLQSVRRNERLYVSDFSMLIFDEVHYTTGSHSYVILNRIVQEWKYDKPQIIGLTASLNVNASQQTDINSMLGGIYSMLALLNAPYLSTITHQSSIDELNAHVTKPDDTVEVLQPGENVLRQHIENYLATKHTKLVQELEKLSKSRHNCFPAGSFRNFKNAKTKDFMAYEPLVQSLIQDLNKLNTPEKMVAQKWTKYIRVYIEARGIVDVMPAMVAFNYMEEAIRALNSEHNLDQFSDFFTEKVYGPLKQRAEGVEPEIVKKLKTTLVNQFKEQPDSRVIIFVTQRSTAQRVSEFLNESGILEQFLNSTTRQKTVGYVLGTNNQGAVQQSPQEQTRVLEQFNSGKLKVIVATSVVEEGLDVTSCNLIIKYNCSSASAIQLVQRRGRARAKNSRSVLLAVHSRIHQDESNALLSEKFMRQCVKIIEQNGHRKLEKEVQTAKEKIERARAQIEADLQILMERNGKNVFKMNCAKCDWTFCKSTEIKKVYSNYMAFHPSVWDNVSVESKRKASTYKSEDTQALSRLRCHKCQQEVGKAYKMRGVYLPQFTVKNVNFVPQNHDMGTATKARWSAVENELFFICEATQRDFESMLNALGNTEANMDKKRILDLDSKQHMKMIESARFIALKEKKEQEERMKRAEEEDAGVKPPTRGSTEFSEDED